MKSASEPAANDRRPEVILDFTAEDGLLYVVLRNIGARSAYCVAVQFDQPFHGLGGAKRVSAMQLFDTFSSCRPRKSSGSSSIRLPITSGGASPHG